MKLLALAVGLSLLSALPFDLAEARHVGPCTHEYGEAIRTGSPKIILQTAAACVTAIPCLLDVCTLP